MSLIDDLYQDIILDHYQNPRNHRRLEHPDVHAEGVNPLCGDQLDLGLKLRGDVIEEIGIGGKGCSISQASASLMSEAVKGKSIAEAQALTHRFKGMLTRGEAPEWEEEYEELGALAGVKQLPVRIKCALLAWETLLQGLHAREGDTKLVVSE